MSEQAIQAEQLFNKKKYKKALLILKKINKKQPSFSSISYTASCYFFEKKYVQANLYFVQALALTSNSREKIEVLSNLAITQIQLNNADKAIEYYITLLAIDGSVATAEHRAALCGIASSEQNHQVIFEYAPNLLNLVEYAQTGLFFLLKSNLSTQDDEKKIDFYLNKLNAQIATFDSSDALRFFELVLTTENQTYITKLVGVVEKVFSHEKWFKEYRSQQDNQRGANHPAQDMPKERVVGGNIELVALINELLIHNESLGAKFHPNLRIIENNGELSVKIYHQTSKTEKLLDIPLKCTPLLNDFNFELDSKGGLVATPIAKPMNPDAINTMLLMQKIYNSGNKINHWKAIFPFIVLKAFPALLKKLASAKPQSNKIGSFCQLLEKKQYDELIIKSFLGSRDFSCQQQELKKCGIVSTKEAELGLFSVIDFLNHKTGSNHYQSYNGTVFVSGLADQTTQELFVHYNNIDPVLTYLIYGFVDVDSPYIFSVPVELTLLNGKKIAVLGSSSTINANNVPDNLKYLSDYLPEIYTQPDGSIKVDKMMVPNTSEGHLLRDVLTIMLNTINTQNTGASEHTIEQEMLHIETQLIVQNRAYWQEVQVLLEAAKLKGTKKSNPALQDVQQLIDFCKSHYQKYSAKFGIGMF